MTVLAMLAVLTALLLAAMTYALSRHSVHRADLNRLHARYLAATGINRMARALFQTAPCEADSFSTPNGGCCAVRSRPWGPHCLIEATGTYGGQQVIRRALLGAAGDERLAAAVVVGEESLPLVASGSTRLRGNVVVGLPGLTDGRIQGEGVMHEDYHLGGLQLLRQVDLPEVDTTLLRHYLLALERRAETPDRLFPGSQHWRDLSVFGDSTDVVEIENNLVLEDVAWQDMERLRTLVVRGRLEFIGYCQISAFCEIAAAGITIGGHSVIDNVLLYAEDSLSIAGEAAFSGLALSRTAISVTERASLRYPSELIVFDHDNCDHRPATISLTSTASLESAVIGLGRAGWEGDGAGIYVDTATVLTGYILCENEVDLRGWVMGSVMTEQFRYELPPTIYVNWLKDCLIDRTRLSYAPVLPMLLEPDSTIAAGIIREDGT